MSKSTARIRSWPGRHVAASRPKSQRATLRSGHRPQLAWRRANAGAETTSASGRAARTRDPGQIASRKAEEEQLTREARRFEALSGPMFQRPGTELFTKSQLSPMVARVPAAFRQAAARSGIATGKPRPSRARRRAGTGHIRTARPAARPARGRTPSYSRTRVPCRRLSRLSVPNSAHHTSSRPNCGAAPAKRRPTAPRSSSSSKQSRSSQGVRETSSPSPPTWYPTTPR